MIPIDIALGFFGISVVLGMAPGPDNIFVLTQSALKGRLAGFIVTLGLCSGIIIHTTAVAFGVAALFQASQFAFVALKVIGAIYLLYLAWQAFRASSQEVAFSGTQRPEYGKLYRRGFIMNITNPKVSIFFLAFLPQFADPSRGPLPPQMLLLGLLFIASTIVVFGSIALLAGTLGEKFASSPRAQLILNRVAGTVFTALAIKLAAAER
ncbi:MAG: LysE family translocator [Arenicellales bacterium]|jgi:threonine/homoserine/homoserine lactone efflux protein